MSTDHLITAPGVFDAQLDIALVVDTAGVGELVRLEPDQGRGLAGAVLELSHDLLVHGTPLAIDEVLVTPAKTIPDRAAGDVHPIDILVINADHQGERVSNLDILSHQALRWLSIEYSHAGGWHGCCGCQRCCSKGTKKRKVYWKKLDKVKSFI